MVFDKNAVPLFVGLGAGKLAKLVIRAVGKMSGQSTLMDKKVAGLVAGVGLAAIGYTQPQGTPAYVMSQLGSVASFVDVAEEWLVSDMLKLSSDTVSLSTYSLANYSTLQTPTAMPQEEIVQTF